MEFVPLVTPMAGFFENSGRRWSIGAQVLAAFEVEGRVLGEPQVLARALHVLHDPERSPHDPGGRRRPGEAHARLEAAVEGFVERAAVAVLAGQDELSGREIDVRLAVVL